MEKKLKLLDKQIEEQSVARANQAVSEARRDKEIKIMEKEKNKEKLINEKAKELINKHKRYIGEEVAQKAINRLDKNERKDLKAENDKEEDEDGNVQEKAKRGRPRRKA